MEFPDKLGVSRQTRPNSIQTFKIDDILLELFLSLYLALKWMQGEQVSKCNAITGMLGMKRNFHALSSFYHVKKDYFLCAADLSSWNE